MVDADGFDQAFEELFMTEFSVTRRLLGHGADAEDAAAEAVARALVAWRRLAKHPNPQAWVARVAGNVAVDQLRRRRISAGADRSSADASEEATLRVALMAAMRKLSKRQREVVAMRYLADLDEAAVAMSLGISVNSVKKHAQRGLGALRGRLGPDVGEVSFVLE